MSRLFILLFLTVLFFSSCNRADNHILSEEEIAEMGTSTIDSVILVADSLPGIMALPDNEQSTLKQQIRLSMHIPPLYDKNVFDSVTTAKFFGLAHASKGELKLLVNSKRLTREIVSIIRNNATDNTDVLILMDKTLSMEDDIDNVKDGMDEVIAAMKKHENVRLAVSLYADRNYNGANWFSFKNFETDLDSAISYIRAIRLIGNEDIPESVYDAFFKCIDQGFWKKGNRHVVILIGDAPPQEIPLSNYTIQDVIQEATKGNISMNFYPIIVTPETVTNKVGLKEYVAGNLISSIYPNPSHGNINVALVSESSYTVQVYNINGDLMLQDRGTNSVWQKDISHLADGTYIIRISNNNKEYETRKFVLQK